MVKGKKVKEKQKTKKTNQAVQNGSNMWPAGLGEEPSCGSSHGDPRSGRSQAEQQHRSGHGCQETTTAVAAVAAKEQRQQRGSEQRESSGSEAHRQ